VSAAGDPAGAPAVARARLHLVAATTHGRYLVDPPPSPGPHPLLLGFHGYGESAAAHLPQLARLDPEHRWLRVAVQGLHRFYTKGQQVVASWMTREDRLEAIADNLAYAAAVRAALARDYGPTASTVVAGFSQGAAQAYRVAAAGGCGGVIALAGDVPPDVGERAAGLPPVLIGRGLEDAWYTAAMQQADTTRLRGAGVDVTVCEFAGGHAWGDAFVDAAARWLEARRGA
jgi:predicted esterase